MNATLSGARKASYFLVLTALIVVARFHLGAALVAGLFAAMILNQTDRALRDAGAAPGASRWLSVALFVVIGGLLALILVAFVRIGLTRLPLLLDRVLPRVDALANRFGVDLAVGNVEDLRAFILNAAKENTRSITAASGLLTRGFFQILAAIAVALLRFLSPSGHPPGKGLEAEFLSECSNRAAIFTGSFDRVMGAQVLISAINTFVTLVFLFALGIPFRSLLTLTTFLCGMIPIAGNLASNALIVAAALARSDHMALAALVFLVVIHKAEYLLNGRIVGARIDTPTWATLVGLLVGEALMGVTGVILAPSVIHYVREELRAIPSR
ncbi:MAG: AI-2E family transporter [Elusimicrobia bacterium]|nr:AI-2E family transporter [Elusimicrobiota bacterium]